MFAKHKLFTLLLIIGLLFVQFAQPVHAANAQTQNPAVSSNQSPPGYHAFTQSSGVLASGSIEGFIYANDTSHPLPGALVEACPVVGEPPSTARIDIFTEQACRFTQSGPTGEYIVSGLEDADYSVRVFPTPGSDLLPNTAGPFTIASGSTVTGANITFYGPPPLPPYTAIEPNRGMGGDGNVPIVNWRDDLILTTTGCLDGTATYTITLEDGEVVRSGRMTEAPAWSGYYSATIAAVYPGHGNARVSFTIRCPDDSHTTTGFDIYIDPSGTVQTRDGLPIGGATVTLYRSGDVGGPFTLVPDGSNVMSLANNKNPDLTDAFGHFGWDVYGGYYIVRAKKAGCVDPYNPGNDYVDSVVLTVPPAVTDLVLVLACPENIYAKLALTDFTTSYDSTNKDYNHPAGIYTITATFQSFASYDLLKTYFNVVDLTNGNLLMNADGGPAGIGAYITAPGWVVHPLDHFDVQFQIGLKLRKNFTLTVDAYGVDPVTKQAIASGTNKGSFTFTILDLSGYTSYLPMVTH